MKQGDIDQYDKFEKDRLQSITSEIVEYFPRMMLFHSIVVTFCAIRTPTDVATVLTYFCIILRIILVFGWYCEKKIVYTACSSGEILINIVLFFITLCQNPYA